jgi:hypothetical protein
MPSIATDYPNSFTIASTATPQDDVERELDGCRSKRKSILHRGRFGAGGSDAAMPCAGWHRTLAMPKRTGAGWHVRCACRFTGMKSVRPRKLMARRIVSL